MILENLKNYKEHLDIFYSVFEKEKKLSIFDKILIKKRFDELVYAEAKFRMLDGEPEEWAHSVACGDIAWQTYFEEREVKIDL